jgi:antitoxin ParD1/3/4
MNVSLTPKLEQFIKKKIRTGRYQTASEVVRDALRAMDENERTREVQLAELRQEIRRGLDELDRGEGIPLDENLAERIKRQGRSRLQRRTIKKK